MKLLGAALGVLAVQMNVVDAHKETQHIFFDCWTESRGFGNTKEGIKVSDKDILPNLNAGDDYLSSISVCTDTVSRLVSGVSTTWGDWNSNTQVWDNERTFTTVGNMGLGSFDDNKALTEAGVATLTEDQMLDAQKYWFQEAAPEEYDFFIIRRDAHKDQAVKDQWTLDRTNSFNAADINDDGALTKWEAYVFLYQVRGLDGSTDRTDNEQERADQAMRLLNSFSEPSDSFKLSDYWRLQDTMLAWYEAGKMDVTGHARGNVAGDDLKTHCETVKLFGGQDDKIINIQVTSNRHGVSQISLQTNGFPLIDMNKIQDKARYGFESTHWQRFQGHREFGGLWGTVDETSGNMNSLGFIAVDTACWNKFDNALGNDLTWDSVIPGTEQVMPVLGADYQSYLDTRTDPLPTGTPTPNPVVWTTYAGIEVNVPVTDAQPQPQPGVIEESLINHADHADHDDHDDHADHDDHDDHKDHADHDHDDEEGHDHDGKKLTTEFESHTHTVNASKGLVVFAVIVWGIVAIVSVMFLVMYCKQRK